MREYGRTGEASRSQKCGPMPPASLRARRKWRPPEKSAMYSTHAYASNTCGLAPTERFVCAMNSERRPRRDMAANCCSISEADVEDRTLMSLRRR